MIGPIRAVAVYCGSSTGSRPSYTQAARELGAELALSGCSVVYGGGSTGMMGAVAAAAMANDGRVIGIIPRLLVAREVAQQAITELRVVQDMHERKRAMIEAADAFVSLPGGLGTLEELVEVWSWGQLAMHSKPIGLLNVEGYFDQFLSFLDHAEKEGFVHATARSLVLADERPQRLLERLAERAAT